MITHLSTFLLIQVLCSSPIDLMSFNIRYGTANDGENSWPHRKGHVISVLRDFSPSAIAIQEALLGQLEYIEEYCPQYQKIGEHRSGNTKGEFSGLLIDRTKLELLDAGQMWLSPTPEEISIGWDAALERTATWAVTRQIGTSGPSFILFSTHFDHRGKAARIASAKLIVDKAAELSGGNKMPVAIMGDFNFTPETEAYNIFESSGFKSALVSSEGTFHNYSGATQGPQIDFIFLNSMWSIESAKILRPRLNGKCASDHDPVVASVNPEVPTGTIGSSRLISTEWKPKTDSLAKSLIPEKLKSKVSVIEKIIQSRPNSEPDFHSLSFVQGAFNYPFHLDQIAGDLTDRLMVLHCEPTNIKSLAYHAIDAGDFTNVINNQKKPTPRQVIDFLSIPGDTFYIEEKSLSNALEVINYSRQVDFKSVVEEIQIPTEIDQPIFGKAMPIGVTGPVLSGALGPDGWRVVGGAGDNTYDMSLIAEVFDIGGNDTYFATDLVVGNRRVIDLGGNDIYTGTKEQGPAAGLFGTWIIDDRAGNDQYGTIGGKFSTGSACFGVGMIIDSQGNDSYRGTGWSIGSGVYGVGVVMDLGSGNDEYLGEFLTIGVGGPRGFGFVFDEAGDDYYLADGPKQSIYGTEGVHCAFSQGMGFGYRKYTAGGIGILCDVAGDDKYQAGEFSQGGGYYHGLGILRDFSGNDNFDGNRYAQGFGVHQAFGVLIDDEGDDNYKAFTAANQGSAWDIAVGCLLDKGGNDSYVANGMAQGSAAQQAIAYLIDLDGEDSYTGAHPAQGESGSNTYHWEPMHAFSFSLLLDQGGDEDSYSLNRLNNTIEITQPNPLPEGSGIGLFIDR